MTEVIFSLCSIMSIVCAVMLHKEYRRERSNMLLWSSLCFAILALTNLVLVIDVIILPDLDFHGGVVRNLLSAIAATLIVFGLVWEPS